MVIVTDANGNLVKNIPERIYQGSNNANSIIFMCPLATTAQAEISFVLANGEVTESFIMTPYDDVGDDTSGLGAWSFNLQRYITQYYGTVQYQIKVYTGVTENENDEVGQIVATVGGSFEVLRGIPSIVPDTPSADVYEQILSYLASILTSLEGGEANALLKYDSTYPYAKDNYILTDTAIYKSLTDNNVGHALNNTTYWAKYEFATPSDISGLQTQINGKQDALTFDATPTENSTNPVYSGGVYTSVSGLDGRITTNANDIDSIEAKIPAQASSSNQLADKDFVNSSINALAAYYMTRNAQGDPFQTKAQLDGTSTFYSGGQVRVPTTNDYCLVIADITKADSVTGYTGFTTTAEYVGYYVIYNNESTLVTSTNKDSVGITAGTTPCYYSIPTTRYSYQGNQWEFQYIVNTTSLTAEQLSALNSGITADLVDKLDGIEAGAEVNAIETISTADGTLSIDANKNVQIPTASNSNLGVVKVSGNGIAILNGALRVDRANTSEISAKTNATNPIVPQTIDYAVKVGITTNANTLTSTEQANAQGWLGIDTLVQNNVPKIITLE